MRRKGLLSYSILIGLVAGMVGLSLGCAHQPLSAGGTESAPPTDLEAQVEGLMEDLLQWEARTPLEMAPCAVMPGSLRWGGRFSRLEEFVMDRLTWRLRKNHSLVVLSRRDWSAFRERAPLTMPEDCLVDRHLVVYEVRLLPDETGEELRIRISASDRAGSELPGIAAEAVVPFGPESPARSLYRAEPETNPYPIGLEERPYESVDRMAFGLSGELASVCRNGVSAEGLRVEGDAIRVALEMKEPGPGVHRPLAESLERALRQALVTNGGFQCVSVEAALSGPLAGGPAQGDSVAIRKERHSGRATRSGGRFGIQENGMASLTSGSRLAARFTGLGRDDELGHTLHLGDQAGFEEMTHRTRPATAVLVGETFLHPEGDRVGVALRAVWKRGPMESASGEFVPVDAAGSYLSGFSAKAYIWKPEGRPAASTRWSAQKTKSEAETAYSSRKREEDPASLKTRQICFHAFPPALSRRIDEVLWSFPGVRAVGGPIWVTDGASCYRVQHAGSLDALKRHLFQNLRTSRVLPFHVAEKKGGRLELYFDGGFE